MPLAPSPRGWGWGGRSKASWGGRTAPFIRMPRGWQRATAPAPPSTLCAPGVLRDRWCGTFHSKASLLTTTVQSGHQSLSMSWGGEDRWRTSNPCGRNFRCPEESSWSFWSGGSTRTWGIRPLPREMREQEGKIWSPPENGTSGSPQAGDARKDPRCLPQGRWHIWERKDEQVEKRQRSVSLCTQGSPRVCWEPPSQGPDTQVVSVQSLVLGTGRSGEVLSLLERGASG